MEIRTYDYGPAGLSGTPNVTRVVYDRLSRKIKEVSPNYYDATLDNGFEYDADNTQEEYTRYSYDAADQVIAQTDALGNTTSYAYNAYGNVIKKNPDLQTVGKNNVNQINWSLYLSDFGFSKTKLIIFSTFSR